MKTAYVNTHSCGVNWTQDGPLCGQEPCLRELAPVCEDCLAPYQWEDESFSHLLGFEDRSGWVPACGCGCSDADDLNIHLAPAAPFYAEVA